MIYLLNTMPNYCPNCGKHHNQVWMDENRRDFYRSVSMGCTCGALFQFTPTADILELSQLHGDLHRYVEKQESKE
ncbi:hypothetical protein LIN78_16855 [Leeia sp. TBRC 13508]|uniref:Uncharacterized protein n=1 Tax=Leeia speluncae TaxID=2884804 RepID=A0ABS8DB46_9NEIS|nr:hypothetical protein [Leeia speluncae]MCB6185218.1 hypothetical protein [Leeia speluncae]